MDRPNIFAGIVRSRYSEAVILAEANASHGELEEAFRTNYGVSGSTMVKSISFFLAMAAYANVPLSAHWRQPAAPRATTNRANNRRKIRRDVADDRAEAVQPAAGSVDTLRVRYVEMLLKKAEEEGRRGRGPAGPDRDGARLRSHARQGGNTMTLSTTGGRA